ETICLKCLEKDPGRRYDTAEALADDLHRFSEGRPISARPVSRLEHQWRWCQRNPLPAALTGLLALTMVLGMAGVVSQWRIAVLEQGRAEESTMQYRDELVRLTTANGHFAVELDAPRRALSWYARGLAQSEGNPGREEMNRRRIGTISQQIPRLAMVFGGEFPLVAARYSPDGGQVATWGSTQLQLVDTDSGIATGEPLESPLQVNLVQYSPDGRHVAVLRQRDREDPASQGEVALLDSQTGRMRFAPVRIRGLLAGCAEFVDDGRTLAVVGQDSLVFLDCETGNRRSTPLPMSYGMWLEATPDRRKVLVCCGYYETECTILVVDVVSGAIVGKPVEKVEVWTSGSHVSRDGRAFATWEYDPTGGRGSGPSFLQLWEIETGMPLLPPFPTQVNVDSVYFPHSRPVVIAHLRNRGLFAWNLRTGIETPLHSSVRDRCRRFVFSPDESRLALDRFAGDQSEVVVVDPWDVSQATIRFSQPGGSLLWSPDGQQLVVDGSTQMRLIDLPSREVRVIDSSGRRGDDVVQFSPDGRQLLTVTRGDVARVWNVSEVRPELRTLDGNANAPHSALALSPSGNLLAIGGGPSDAMAYRNNLDRTGRLRVWDWREGRPLGPQVDLASRVQEIVFSADDRRAALVTESGVAVVVDPSSGTTQLEVGDSESPVAAVALSPSNQLIAYRSGVAPHEKGYAPSFDKRHARLEFWSLDQPPRLERTQELDSHVLFAL
ncbi:MAG: hypothetical protein NT069_26680, partial [Planctomycetota bacterium]|nr:hypothetical protein [Planctomycetota bacterium]